jgi:alpha-galactosidase
MTPTQREMEAATEWTRRLAGEEPPFSLTYVGRPSVTSLAGWRREGPTLTDPATGLSIRVQATACADFPAVEWTLYLKNEGADDTPIIEDLQALDVVLPLGASDPCTIHHAKGALCSTDDFEPLARTLTPNGTLRVQPGGGRSSSEALPFFNVDLGGRGFVLAIGWTGEWAAEFSRDAEGRLRVRAGMDRTHLRLHPGEGIRTPLVLMLWWEGDRLRGHNLLRRHILAHHRPTPNGQPLVAPLCNGNWGGTPAEVHVENIRKIIEHDLPFEFYWIDAEWFGKAGHWMENAGNWEPRRDLYPEGFRPISDLLHASGRKLLLWFEPERVAPGTPFAEEHGEWLLEVPPEKAVTWADYGGHMPRDEWVRWESKRNQLNVGDRLFNLGDPAARQWLTDFLSAKIDEFGLDCLRWDSNIAQLEYWRHADAPDRQGNAEIGYVEGQYALWDELLRRHPGLIIDNCASGGRRIDLESIRRSTPLWRTDYAVGHRDPTPCQCHTYGLMFWVPLNGTGGGYLKDLDRYTLRSMMCSSLVVGLSGHGDAQQPLIPEDYPFAHAKALLEEYLRVREYFCADYYPLTEYTQAEDAWMAYQLDRPERGDGLVVVLKRPRSPFTRAVLPLHALRPSCQYEVTNLDTEAMLTATGAELAGEGLAVELAARPDSALFVYRAREAREP